MLHRIVLLKTIFVLFFVVSTGTPIFAGQFRENAMIRSDWLFQAEQSPTWETIQNELTWTSEMAKRISQMSGKPNLDSELVKLKAFEEQFVKLRESQADETTILDLYLHVRELKRTIFFKNPVIDFDQILLIDNPYPKGKPGDITDEWGHEARHRNGFMAESGGSLLSVGLHPGGLVRDVLPGLKGSFWRPDVSFSGDKILLSYRPVGERSFHLYECHIDGSGLKQLTFGDYDDIDPIYAPDGKILFCTTRQHSYVRCMPMTHSFALARCDADGKNIYVISANGEPDYLPSVMNDGKVIFTRWEYTEKAIWRVQSLWTCDPSGTNMQIFWGNQSVWPDVLTEARSIPGSNKVMFTGVGHHGWFDGSIGTIDPAVGIDYPFGLNRITREVPWAEVGNGPNDPPPVVDYHNSGAVSAYKTPYPLSEEYFLVSAREGNHLYSGSDNGWFFRLYLMDIYGNKELIYRGKYNAYHAIPIKARPKPQVKTDSVDWSPIGVGAIPKPGILYSNDVFEGAPEVLKLKGKSLRIIQMDPKTYTTWHKTVQHDGPSVSVFQADGVKRILGTVPIEKDGSIAFEIPPGKALSFEMLDEQGRAIHVMRTFTSVMPGEVRGCFGCHESTMTSVTLRQKAAAGKALAKGVKKPVPPSWGTEESIGYLRFVQPVLDRHCAKCHQNPEHEAYSKLNMVLRPAKSRWSSWTHTKNDISPFMEPYYTLVTGATTWGAAKPKNERNVPDNLAGIYLVEGFYMNDPEPLKTLPPYSAFSPVSQLIHHATSGEHNGIKITGEDRERLIAWVDCNGPYLGDEEIRSMYDPISPTIETIPVVRPRLATAPRINRFDIRQDGDSESLCGPVKLMPEKERNFDPASACKNWEADFLAKELESAQSGKHEIEIIDANYGSREEIKRFSVLEQVKKSFNNSRYIPIKNYKEAFGDRNIQEPATLRITYRIDGSERRYAAFGENEPIVLPR
jgi:hypothetical protein